MNFKEKGIAVLIPAYRPSKERLVALIEALKPYRFADVIIVDDGGGEEFAEVFQAANGLGCTVVTHAENKGKGRALKTGLSDYQNRFPKGLGVVTADADGQHVAEDIVAVAETLGEYPDKLILGCRTLGKDMPITSRFGNKMTRTISYLVSGVHISDTQTGLRGIPTASLDKIMALKGERYDYEMHMLLELKPMKLGHIEVPIQTIYLEGNKSSHFKRLRDSFLIYQIIFKYIFAALASFLIDYGIYALLNVVLPLFMAHPKQMVYGLPLVVIIANMVARLVSSGVNFSLNRKILLPKHHKGQHVMHQAGKYFLLVLITMLADTLLVSSLSLVISKYVAKILVGLVIFCVNFFVQKRVVYV